MCLAQAAKPFGGPGRRKQSQDPAEGGVQGNQVTRAPGPCPTELDSAGPGEARLCSQNQGPESVRGLTQKMLSPSRTHSSDVARGPHRS